ncbi:Scr1 family TA system antitoxin-like transcriptional regulator [Planomonospora sp. ID82291]|uniref:Scr1 family TA system antitoxin-like transcriptional regulator n=1 Tax=Planomonospora sp. ID82291 TaxID=2738136 RepID=UPI0018C440D0|nr:Scr1 family TA system antitoxin-like transcriptional regulator [Planomonospora sp. ID82291]MBG0818316.1 hypothetical protein [Planomonospora sp. ID82291]
MRIPRQWLLLGTGHLIQFVVVLDEAVLLRRVGGREVMRGQLERLVEVGERPDVEIRMLPFLVP